MRRIAVSIVQLLGAVAFAGLCIALAFSQIDLAKIWPIWFTAFLFGYLCYLTRGFWKKRLYWAIFVACLLVHLAILLAVMKAFPHLGLLYYGVFGSIEGAAIYRVLLGALE